MKLFAIAVLVLPTLAAPTPGEFGARRGEDGAEVGPSQALLEAAEAEVVRGNYEQALRAYRRLAELHPATEAGAVAARRARPSAYLGTRTIVDHGPGANRIDVALMGDGYELKHQSGFAKLAEDIPPLFERQRTFREYWSYFNFHAVHLVSAENGVDGFGREYDTALGAFTSGTFAGHVAIDRKLVREVWEQMPGHDSLAIVFVKNGVLGTGGSGIATIGGRGASTTIHEWGHAFAHLGDEYATQTHERGALRESANVSPKSDPKEVPWAHFIAAKVPGVGVYQGAAGQVRGAFKPTSGGCVMESGEFFCPPCVEAIVLRIHSIVDPIDGCEPPAHALRGSESLLLQGALDFELRVMQPASHALEVRWWLLPERGAPPEPRGMQERYATGGSGRAARGPLAPIAGRPTDRTRADRHGVHRFRLSSAELEPGRYRLVARARDDTRIPGERFPWVLKDERGLLESERAWWITVRGPAEAR